MRSRNARTHLYKNSGVKEGGGYLLEGGVLQRDHGTYLHTRTKLRAVSIHTGPVLEYCSTVPLHLGGF